MKIPVLVALAGIKDGFAHYNHTGLQCEIVGYLFTTAEESHLFGACAIDRSFHHKASQPLIITT